jgi:hypothetical protein
LQAKRLPGDKDAEKVLSLISRKMKLLQSARNRIATAETEEPSANFHNKILRIFSLGLILILASVPSSVLWFSAQGRHALTAVPAYCWGAWAIIALWVLFAKGLPALMEQGTGILGPVWAILGLTNLATAILCLGLL